MEKAAQLALPSIDLDKVQERYHQLDEEVSERDHYYTNMLASWKVFMKKKNHFKQVLMRTSLINAFKKCKTMGEVANDVANIEVS